MLPPALTETLSLPPLPSMLSTPAPAETLKVSSPVPPDRFSTLLNELMSGTVPLPVPVMSQVLVPSAWLTVSLPPPPSTAPESDPVLPMSNVSDPVPPVRFSTLVKSPMSVTSPALADEIVQVLESSAWVIVSLSPPPSIVPASPARDAMLNVSGPLPPVRFSTALKALKSDPVPLPDPVMFQVLVPSAWLTVSLPPPPSMSPESDPVLPMLNVSTPLPPVRFSMLVKSPISVTSPSLADEIVQVLESSAWVIVSLSPPPSIVPARPTRLAMLNVSGPLPPVRFSMSLKALRSSTDPPLVEEIVHVLVPSAWVSVSVPPPPSISPVSDPPLAMLNVSASLPPVRFSTALKALTSGPVPLPAPVMSQVLVPSAWVIVSLPPPPSMSPESDPVLPMLNVSAPVPPVRFSTLVKSPISVTSPALADEIVQVLVPSAWVIVSLPPPPSIVPSSVTKDEMLNVSAWLPPVRFSTLLKSVTPTPPTFPELLAVNEKFRPPVSGPIRVSPAPPSPSKLMLSLPCRAPLESSIVSVSAPSPSWTVMTVVGSNVAGTAIV